MKKSDLNKKEYNKIFKQRHLKKINAIYFPFSSNDFVYKKIDFENKKVLDFGSNIESPNYLHCKKVNAKYFGFDIDESTVKWLKEKKIFIDFWKTKQKFDIIIASQVYEHLNKKEQEQFIKQAKKLLKKNGLLILEYPFVMNLGGVGFWRDRTHTMPPSIEDEALFIDQHGFESELFVAGISFWGPRNLFRAILNWLIGFYPQHNIVIISKKK